MVLRNISKGLLVLAAAVGAATVLGSTQNGVLWSACNNSVCDSGSKACTDSTQYAVFVFPAYKCGINAWPSDCSNWNGSQVCSETVHYLGDCSTVNGSPSYTYQNECG